MNRNMENEIETPNPLEYRDEEDTTSSSRSDSSGDEPPDDFFDEDELQVREGDGHKLFPQQKQVGGFLEIDCGSMTVRALIGLGIAGLGGSLIGDVYGMFYVDCFLRAYKLPMRIFGIGSAIFAFVHTANDVAGAYFLDWYCSGKQNHKRENLVGLSGCLFALSLMGPFFRWGPRDSNTNSKNFWDGLHFVGSLSLYDTMFSFNCILQGSIVSDNHSMTENQRITFFALRDMVGILAPLVVTKIGLSLFDISNLKNFRIYVVGLVVISSLLCIWAQALINQKHRGGSTSTSKSPGKFLPSFLREPASSSGYSKVEASNESTVASKTIVDGDIEDTEQRSSKLGFWQALKDFAAHPNFRYWIGMEMLMEGQNTFMGNFQKTFVDQLLRDDSNDAACDWMLALLDPCTQIVGLMLFIPIKRYGYAVLYKVVFVTNICMASALLLSNGLDNATETTFPIASFLFLSSVLSNAMAGAGFGLAMCDMVLEMKHGHSVIEGRLNPPSLAGMFMGVNALFCKPAESVLPILAASFLGEDYGDEESSENARVVLYRLLVFPPLVCSVLQLFCWSQYSLNPQKTAQLRAELEDHEKQLQQQQKRLHEYGEDSFNEDTVIEMHQLS